MYINQQQLEQRFGEQELIELTDRERMGEINTEVLASAISDATAIIDSHLQSAGYTLPLEQLMIDASPLTRYAGDVVRYLLMDDGVTEVVEKRNDQALRWLRDLGRGLSSLGPQDNSVQESAGIVVVKSKSNTDWGTY